MHHGTLARGTRAPYAPYAPVRTVRTFHCADRHASGRRITSTVSTSRRPIHIASVSTKRLTRMQIGVIGHRPDLVEAGADVAERRRRRRDAGDDVGAEQDDDRGAHRERQHVEQEEHDHALEDRGRHHPAVELDREDGARVQRAPQLLQRELGEQHVPHDLGPAARGARAAADEHQAEQHRLRLVVPELKIDARESGGGDDRQHLEQGVPNSSPELTKPRM